MILLAENLIIINKADTPPFEITDEKGKFLAAEDLRLKYRQEESLPPEHARFSA